MTALPPLGDRVDRRVGISVVCTGNICRSPMAEVVLRHLVEAEPMADGFLVDRVQLSSAGTGPWHEGESMDPRAAAALAAAGYLDHGHIAHQFDAAQVDPGRADRLDLLVAMDRRHQQTLRSLTAGRFPDDRIVMLRSFDRRAGGAVDVADPYYGSEADFAACLAIVEAGCRGLVRALAASLAIPAG